VRRFTSPEHNMIRNLDRKIQLAKKKDEQLLKLLVSKNKHEECAASLELARREDATSSR